VARPKLFQKEFSFGEAADQAQAQGQEPEPKAEQPYDRPARPGIGDLQAILERYDFE
jgi:hypothetical protein